MLLLGGQVELPIGPALIPLNVPKVGHPLNRHEDALQAIGQLDRDWIQSLAAGLLKVGELCDLKPIQPDLPAEAPCGQGRLLPVVFHEADVVDLRIDAKRLQGAQVEFLRVAGLRLEDHLVLVVETHTIRVFSVAGIVGPNGRFHIRHAPGLRPQHP